MRAIHIAVAAWLAGTGAVCANDGFGGLSATGLIFGQTDAVAMLEEDLVIGPDQIEVTYLFRNLTDRDVTGEVIFPLPPISVGQLMMSDWNLPAEAGRENLLDFSVTVNGQPQPFSIDRLAVVEPEWVEGRPRSAAYDTPGRDVTSILTGAGVPLTLDAEALLAHLATLAPAQRDALVANGLLEVYEAGTAQQEVFPNWSIVLRYHWTQTFPAGQELTIHHRYENRAEGGIFVWRDLPTDDWQQELTARYCIDRSTSAALAKRLQGGAVDSDGYVTGLAYNIAYVLRTANSWAGPIGRFRLTLDKGHPDNTLSLCAKGLTKTGPTRFTLEQRDFRPDADLEVLIVRPLGD